MKTVLKQCCICNVKEVINQTEFIKDKKLATKGRAWIICADCNFKIERNAIKYQIGELKNWLEEVKEDDKEQD